MPQIKNILQIAVDGPVASGKGTVCAQLAKKLNITYIYTGAMYRALALACLESKIDFNNEFLVFEKLKKIKIDLQPVTAKDSAICKVYLDRKEITNSITQPDIAQGASLVARHEKVRQEMVKLQKNLAKGRSVVMEGRDIGTRVLPNAHLKIFLDADVVERSRRRFKQHQEQGKNLTLDQVLEDTIKRDQQDTERKSDPLKKTSDMWYLDTSKMTISQVVDAIIDRLKKDRLIL